VEKTLAITWLDKTFSLPQPRPQAMSPMLYYTGQQRKLFDRCCLRIKLDIKGPPTAERDY